MWPKRASHQHKDRRSILERENNQTRQKQLCCTFFCLSWGGCVATRLNLLVRWSWRCVFNDNVSHSQGGIFDNVFIRSNELHSLVGVSLHSFSSSSATRIVHLTLQKERIHLNPIKRSKLCTSPIVK